MGFVVSSQVLARFFVLRHIGRNRSVDSLLIQNACVSRHNMLNYYQCKMNQKPTFVSIFIEVILGC